MKNISKQPRKGLEKSSQESEFVLLIGLGQFGAGLTFTHFSKHSLADEPIAVKSAAGLNGEKEIDAMATPVVVVLGLSPNAADLVTLMRQHWPQTSIVIAADESQMTDVYPLIAMGAHDYISIKASNDDLESKCLLRIGSHRLRVQESSRSFGRLTMNLMQRTVTNGKETAHLTPIEVKIVRTLADNLGSVVERNTMKQICWGDMEITDNALNRKIYEVRRTLRKLSEQVNIRTIYGLGFELRVRG